MAEKKDPDPFPHLPRRSFYGDTHLDAPAPSVDAVRTEKIAAAMDRVVAKFAPKKRGRPVADKPWEREGISRMTWYRRRKETKT